MHAPSSLATLDVRISARLGPDREYVEIATVDEIAIPLTVTASSEAAVTVETAGIKRAIAQALVDAGLAMLGEKRQLAETIEVISTKVGDEDTWSVKIDGHEFPWLIAKGGVSVGPIDNDVAPTVTLKVIADNLLVDHQLGLKSMRPTN